MNEIWKDIIGYELYEVSNLGRIRNKKSGKYKAPIKNWAGYMRVQLCKPNKDKIFSIHRLVAQAFIPNPNNYPEINHLDHVRHNNNVNNLEWCTRSRNAQYSFTRPDRKKAKAWLGKSGELHHASMPVYQIENGKIIGVYGSIGLAEKDFKHVGDVVRGKRKSAGGFQWKMV